jgi:hypothetical protein
MGWYAPRSCRQCGDAVIGVLMQPQEHTPLSITEMASPDDVVITRSSAPSLPCSLHYAKLGSYAPRVARAEYEDIC